MVDDITLINDTNPMKKVSQKSSIRQTLAKNIRNVRNLKRISQEGLALNSDLSRTYIGEIERENKSATIDAVEKIAQALGLSVSDLLNENLSLDEVIIGL